MFNAPTMYDMMTNDKQRMLSHLGRLARQRRGEIGFTGRIPFAKAIGIGEASLKTFELGRTEPNTHNKAKIERGLQWKEGIIGSLLDLAEYGQTEPSEIGMCHLEGREIPEPVSRASELDDVELLTELIRRLERLRDSLDGKEPDTESTPNRPKLGLVKD